MINRPRTIDVKTKTNPGKATFWGLLARSQCKALRGDLGDDLVVWDAHESTHHEMAVVHGLTGLPVFFEQDKFYVSIPLPEVIGADLYAKYGVEPPIPNDVFSEMNAIDALFAAATVEFRDHPRLQVLGYDPKMINISTD